MCNLQDRRLLKVGILVTALGSTACATPPEDDVMGSAAFALGAAVSTRMEPVSAAAGTSIAYTGASAAVTVKISSMGVTMPYLVNSSGSALYTIEGADGPAACTGQCLQVWPPLLIEDAPASVGTQLQPALLGSVQRDNGSTQIGYNGHLLYRYARDTAGGPPSGHDYTDQWGEWYLLGPDGELLPEGIVGGGAEEPSVDGY